MSHNVAVMRGGKIVEAGTRREVFETPREDYTTALIAAVPIPDPTVYGGQGGRMGSVRGLPQCRRPAADERRLSSRTAISRMRPRTTYW
jgi:ABC-type dipeptide/oligopeptide/nickel transport system ATPase component